MAWIWSDELAAAAESAGLDHREIAAWRRRPVAFALRSDEPPESLARQILGLAPREDDAGRPGAEDPAAPAECTCGAREILAHRVADG